MEDSESRLCTASGLPPQITLCGKLAVLDRVLTRLKRAGHRVGLADHRLYLLPRTSRRLSPKFVFQVLIFSTMTRVLDILEEYLDWRGYVWRRLDGSSSAEERAEQVADFNAPGSSAFVFLLSVRAGGVGLNLQTADTVIMVRLRRRSILSSILLLVLSFSKRVSPTAFVQYDTDWNSQIDQQAQARVHRLGQTKKVGRRGEPSTSLLSQFITNSITWLIQR